MRSLRAAQSLQQAARRLQIAQRLQVAQSLMPLPGSRLQCPNLQGPPQSDSFGQSMNAHQLLSPSVRRDELCGHILVGALLAYIAVCIKWGAQRALSRLLKQRGSHYIKPPDPRSRLGATAYAQDTGLWQI